MKTDYDETSKNIFAQMIAATDPQMKDMYRSLLTEHLKKTPSNLKNSPNKGYVPPATLFSVEALTKQFRNEDFGEDMPQTLPEVHQEIKELRKTIKENRRLCVEKHNELSLRILNAQASPASSSQGPVSGKTEN